MNQATAKKIGKILLSVLTYLFLALCILSVFITALAERVAQTGAILLDNESTRVRGLLVGGLSSGYGSGERQGRLKVTPTPDLAFLDRFAKERGPKLLMCHHPEYYDRYLAPRDTGLILAGHAHGGQWRLFGRGLFAPGQGMFPRYTAGLYHSRLLLSRGLCAAHRYIPRIFNPRELVAVTLTPKNSEKHCSLS